jgi:hypothetical protein
MRAEAKVRSLLTRSTHDRERLVSAPLARCRASREGLLAELIPGAQLRPQERVLMPDFVEKVAVQSISTEPM